MTTMKGNNPELSSASISHTKKYVYLIRHAESEENRRIAAFSRSFQSLRNFSLPKTSDVLTSTELLNAPAQVDSLVSSIGANQISHMGEKLEKENFITNSGINLVLHSPLLRARQTSEGMLGCVAASLSDDEKKVSIVSKVIQTDLLLEKTPSEWTPIYYSRFLKRIADFEAWLGEQPEETIAIVGHSQFFKTMLGLKLKFDNCEVWKVDFDAKQGNCSKETIHGIADDVSKDDLSTGNRTLSLPSCWSNLEKVYACEIQSSPKTV
mmetsp:Transcript_42962/g.48430  ORF Transcript_42962/g.48430 Transcript_42962/m.48430 type:complete len:266 (-) Transcript_42962:299-1096(-)